MKKIIFIILSALVQSIVFAEVPPKQLDEINYLLNFISNSHCILNRNGSDHDAYDAVAHIEKKYEHFLDEIKTTEDFIKYSATKSLLSGDYYQVKCSGKKTITTQQWLLEELKQYRAKKSSGNLKKKSVICEAPRPKICTREYMPVCAKLKTNVFKTYATGCTACADVNVISYTTDSC